MTHGRPASSLGTVTGLTAEEWRVARIAHANLLLIASDGAAEKIVDALGPDLCELIEVWHPGCRLILPPMGSTGTLILQDIGAMPRDDQRRLHEWFEVTDGRTRVVSSSRQPLFPLLEVGTFAEALYYRLNVLCFRVIECDS